MIDYIRIKNESIKLDISRLGDSFNRSKKKDGSKNYKFKIYRRKLQIFDPADDDDDENDTENSYPYKHGKYDSYMILIANSVGGFTLYGSLRKWWFNPQSANADLNFLMFCKAIKSLAKKIGVHEDVLWGSHVSTVEIGGNLKLTPLHKTIIGSLEAYPTRTRFGDRRHTVYFHQKTNAEEIIFYDKITQLYRRQKSISNKTKTHLLKKVFILRYEIKVNTPSKTQFANYINPLRKIKENWIDIIDKWVATFNKVQIIVSAPPKLPKDKEYLNLTDLKNYFTKLGIYHYGGLDAVYELVMESVHPKKTDDRKKDFRDLILEDVELEFLEYIKVFVEAVEGKAEEMKKGFCEVNNIL